MNQVPENQTGRAVADCIAIVGVGLLGASLGLALKRARLCQKVVGIGRAGSPSLAQALEMGAIDDGHTDAATGVAGAQIVILATNVGQFPTLMDQIRTALAAGTLVTDVGSTKKQVMRWAAKFLPKTVDFIGSHPMAGSEKRGSLAARADLYQNALCLLCPPPIRGRGACTPLRVGAALAKTEIFWQSIGMKTMQLPAQRHDQWVAAISHLPHAAALATVLAAARTPEAFPAIAGGFLDTTRVAGGDPTLWADIFLTNQQPVRKEIGELIRQLKNLQSAIARNDRAAILVLLERAHELRNSIAAQRAVASSEAPATGGLNPPPTADVAGRHL